MYRNIATEFWTDSKIEQTNCQEKLLILYLLTAPHGNLAGCYEVTFRRIEVETGIKSSQAEKAMVRLCELGIVSYSPETNEVLVRNWGKYNWSKSPKTKAALDKQISRVKNPLMKQELADEYEELFNEPYPYHIDTVSTGIDTRQIPPVSVSVSVPVSDKGVGVQGEGDKSRSDSIAEIVSHLNSVLGTNYKPTTKKTVSLINARFNEGFTVDDFKAVIDTKSSDWKNDAKMAEYLRPETLFGTKFESYLQKGKAVSTRENRFAKYR